MRFLRFLFPLLLSITWILLLHNPVGSLPALGKLFDPVKGFWSNAEPAQKVPATLTIPGDGRGNGASVILDDRLVPHISAVNDERLYFAQGYLHAYYRLWQMDMQTRAAAGRLSEVIGESTLSFDRNQRRKGMVWAAENSLRAMLADERTKKILDAYTSGVNAYIGQLTYKDYPLEYKLMGFEPEPWTNLKCALLLKYMADDLTGTVDDINMSYLKEILSPQELDFLYPDKIEGSQPVIPSGTTFGKPSLPVPQMPYGSVFAQFKPAIQQAAGSMKYTTAEEQSGIGSNNWAVSGEMTKEGAAILCNDPHLSLTLPSIWYELQMTAPGINCYGVSIPGAPGIIIGFNDSISWGVTNNYRDVMDFYEIVTEDPRLYFFDGKEIPFNERYEKVYIKGRKEPYTDTVRFTLHGPLMYDEHFPEPSGSGKKLAVSWMAHKATNELLAVYLYNRATGYSSFVQAIHHFECPAQNFLFADRQGNIAIWGQGRFINKWKDQGKYVMRGDISATLWGDTIPMNENPHVYNPERGFLASANQNVTDASYPYWYNGDFSEFRSWIIHHELGYIFKTRNDTAHKDTTSTYTPASLYSKDGLIFPYLLQPASEKVPDIQKNMNLQNSTFSLLNASLKYNPVIANALQALPDSLVRDGENLSAESQAATFYQVFWRYLYRNIWSDEFKNLPVTLYPSPERTLQLLKDTSLNYFDDKTTEGKETLADIVYKSVQQAIDTLSRLRQQGTTEWYKVKNTTIRHMARLNAFSYPYIKNGGWGNTVNAVKSDHGPSWRMIVSMQPERVKAFVVYPGGQSGNPGSPFYASFLNSWTEGKYYEVDFKERR